MKRILVYIFLVVFAVTLEGCSSNNPYKKRVHHGIPTSVDKATRKNERFKKKNSKAGPSSTTKKKKEHKKKVAKTKHRNQFNHH